MRYKTVSEQLQSKLKITLDVGALDKKKLSQQITDMAQLNSIEAQYKRQYLQEATELAATLSKTKNQYVGMHSENANLKLQNNEFSEKIKLYQLEVTPLKADL